jgi:hypothetical protein
VPTDLYTKKASEIRCPIAGQIGVISTSSTSAGTQDMRLIGPQSASMGNDTILPPSTPNNPPGALERFVEFYADGVDYGIVFGATSAAVSSSNAPSLTATGPGAGACIRIPAGQARTYVVESDTFWLGYVPSSSSQGYLRMSVTSR